MKKLLTIISVLFSFTLTAQQKIIINDKGDYVVVKKAAIKDTVGIPSGKTFTDGKGIKYPVFLSKDGKPYIIRTSKKNNIYKQYLKVSTNQS